MCSCFIYISKLQISFDLNKNKSVCMFQNVEVEEEHVDERSVDDLLSFINGNDGGIPLLLVN